MSDAVRCTARGEKIIDPQPTPTPTDAKLGDGQYADHWVLCESERAKGYIRPMRLSYIHVGIAGPRFETRDLTEAERERFGYAGYVKFEIYPAGHHASATGRFWTQQQLDSVGKGCGVLTRMPQACAETYAREPGYYGSTFCCGCGDYFKVGRDGEFVWDGTEERVGT